MYRILKAKIVLPCFFLLRKVQYYSRPAFFPAVVSVSFMLIACLALINTAAPAFYLTTNDYINVAALSNSNTFYTIDQSYYYPATSSYQPAATFSNGFYIPGNPGTQYFNSYYNPSGNFTAYYPSQGYISYVGSNSISSQGEYYFPSVNFNNSPSSVFSLRSPSSNYYYPTTTISNFSVANTGSYVVNSPFSPFTPFFSGPQVPSYASLNGTLINWPVTGIRRVNAVASLVLANATYGMYCWEPIGWLEAGVPVGMWDRDLPIRAQSLDKRGFLLDAVPTFSVQPTGQIGTAALLRADILLYEGLINAGEANDYLTTVTVDNVSSVAVTHRRSASCDVCHPTPPGHIASSFTWGRCHSCHNLGNVLHVHAYKANIAIDNCYQCHPTGCLSGLHGSLGIWCTSCHGSLADAPNNQMKISGQLGLPYCADCHAPVYAENLPALFVDSAGHGGVWCINCHAPTHIEVSPPLGYNNCQICHTIQASQGWMGPDCGLCHTSSLSPHLVTR